jgi:hypothetical protein
VKLTAHRIERRTYDGLDERVIKLAVLANERQYGRHVPLTPRGNLRHFQLNYLLSFGKRKAGRA